jgi:two-component system chemotaxis response regulator CheY
MVVEDSADVRWTTSLILQRADFEVIEAANGREALAMLDNERVDAIVTDLNMPELDGIGLAKGVRSHRAGASIPIILTTALTDESKIKEGNLAGVTEWVLKPYRPDQLLAALKRVIS